MSADGRVRAPAGIAVGTARFQGGSAVERQLASTFRYEGIAYYIAP